MARGGAAASLRLDTAARHETERTFAGKSESPASIGGCWPAIHCLRGIAVPRVVIAGLFPAQRFEVTARNASTIPDPYQLLRVTDPTQVALNSGGKPG